MPATLPDSTGGPSLYLVDFQAAVYRAYFAPFRELNSPSGEPTRATYVFTQFLLNLLAQRRPTWLAMCLDVGDRETFRSTIDPMYKAHRDPPPEDLGPQKRRIEQIVAALGIPLLRVPGFEADDLLATLAARYGDGSPPADAPQHVVLVSRDKDLRQLLGQRVTMYDPMNDAFVTPDSLRADLGFGPEQAVEVQTLCGDSVDGVPGVKGVGEKTAAKLIARYGTAAAVLAAADEQTPALKANLKAFADQLERTRQLVTLRRDVPLDFDLEAARVDRLTLTAAEPIFAELGFTRLGEQARALAQRGEAGTGGSSAAPPAARPKPASPAPAPATTAPLPTRTTARDGRYELVDTPEKLAALAQQLAQAGTFAFDTETTAFGCHELQLAGLSFSFAPLTGFYVPVQTTAGVPESMAGGSLFDAHLSAPTEAGPGARLALADVAAALGPVLADPAVGKVAHNAKFDLLALRAAGLELGGLCFDTLLAAYLLNPASRLGLKELGLELLNHQSITFEDVAGKGKDQRRFDELPTDQAAIYAAEDADVTWRLYLVLRERLAAEDQLDALLRDLELPLVHVLADMEWRGVRLDVALLRQISADLARQLDELTTRIHALAGGPFLINSTKQLAEILFDRLQLPVIRKTKTGRSTDAEVLEELAYQESLAAPKEGEPASADPADPARARRELPRLILDYRELYKLRSTYLEPLAGFVSPATGRVHARFNQTGAETGRLSCSDPNLQNIPIRTAVGREIRRAFVPGEAGWVLLSADYSQIELRILAHLSGDEGLRAAFAADADIHAFVASQVFNVPLGVVTREQRGRAKAVNFGIVYGQTAFGLARTLSIPQDEAAAFIASYKARYPGIVAFLERCVAEAEQTGAVRTMLGRRRWIEGIADRNAARRSQAQRLAINTVVQGSAADLIKRAMVNLHRRLRAEGRPSRLLIQVHDELVFETPAASVAAEAEVVRAEMVGALTLDVPVKVDIGWGENWKEGK